LALAPGVIEVTQTRPEVPDPRSMTSPGSTPPRRILVVDDEPHIARIVELKLQDAGFAVEARHDGEAALERLRQADPIDLILLDIMLPRMSGLEVLASLRTLPHRCDTPVIMLTAKGQDTDRFRADDLGVSDFLTKPFSPKKLLARIEDLLGT
jgi:DNA-binding response OmpR family regulator